VQASARDGGKCPSPSLMLAPPSRFASPYFSFVNTTSPASPAASTSDVPEDGQVRRPQELDFRLAFSSPRPSMRPAHRASMIRRSNTHLIRIPLLVVELTPEVRCGVFGTLNFVTLPSPQIVRTRGAWTDKGEHGWCFLFSGDRRICYGGKGRGVRP
jgi:hypothetical protein